MAIQISGNTIIDDSQNITSTGNATFGGNVQLGLNPDAGADEGILLRKNGRIQLASNQGSTPVWSGYTVGTSTATSVVNADGSATFAGRLLVGTTSASLTNKFLLQGNTSNANNGGYMRLQTANSIVAGTSLGAIGFGDSAFNGALIEATGDVSWSPFTKGSRLQFSTTANGATSPTVRMHVNSSGNVGIGTINPTKTLEVNSGATNVVANFKSTDSTAAIAVTDNGGSVEYGCLGNNALFMPGGVEQMRLDSSGRLLLGTSTARGNIYNAASGVENHFQIEGTGYVDSAMTIVRNSNDANFGGIVIGKTRGTTLNSNTIVQSGDPLGQISFQGADGSRLINAAAIQADVDGTPGSSDMPGRLTFSTAADGASSPTERMRITSGGDVLISKITSSFGVDGIVLADAGYIAATRTSATPLNVTRNGTDGTLVNFEAQNVSEGSISVSGTAVSYNGAHLSRWSQLAGGADRTEILRGSVLSNLDEMCEWGEEDNEQLNRMKVSDVEGDRNVSGVFQAWDDDDDTYTNDFYCAMTGDFVIRIAQGTTVARGDLLMSAGDGTAKPQDDDIMRSKTIAKVTSTVVSETYSDGSYCVPCVLMAC